MKANPYISWKEASDKHNYHSTIIYRKCRLNDFYKEIKKSISQYKYINLTCYYSWSLYNRFFSLLNLKGKKILNKIQIIKSNTEYNLKLAKLISNAKFRKYNLH